MKSKIGFLIIVLLVFPGLSALYAQQEVLSSGGTITGVNGSLSFSVGQIAHLTMTGTYGIITEGVQQPFEILIMEGIGENGITLECLIYPNPVSEVLFLKINNHDARNFCYQLYTLTGVLLQNNNIVNHVTAVSLEGLEPSTYLLIITENNICLKTVKIIKK